MSDVYDFIAGDLPLLISVPHDGRKLAPGQAERLSEHAKRLPDTDWHVLKLYEFAKDIGANMIAANYSRYVVDLNRGADDFALYEDQVSTGLCPSRTFTGEDIYQSGDSIENDEQVQRVSDFWQPYHDKIASTLAAIKESHGYALLWDGHSIPGEVPLLFDGVLPDLNLGSNDGAACSARVAESVLRVAAESGFSAVLNGRFRGGFITRHYGDPEHHVHAIQLELSQRNYMNEETLAWDDDKASRLIPAIKDMLTEFLNSARSIYAQKNRVD